VMPQTYIFASRPGAVGLSRAVAVS
jgi:hypothetical protein